MKINTLRQWLLLPLTLFSLVLFTCATWAAENPRLSAKAGKQMAAVFALYEQEKLSQALLQLNEVKARSSFDKAYVQRFKGNLYWQLGNEKKAIEALQIALSENALGQTEHRESQRMLADLYLNQAQTLRAIVLYKELIAQAESESLYQHLALAYYQQKSWQALIEASNKALALGTTFNKNLHLLQLNAFYALENYAAANKILFKLSETYPQDKRWWMQLAANYQRLKQDKKALATYELANLKGFITGSSEIQNLATLRAMSGAPYQAASLLESAVNEGLVAANAEVYKHLAMFWQAARESDKAQFYWGKSASLSGNAQHRLIQAQLLRLSGNYEKVLSALDKINSDDIKIKGKVALTKIETLFALKEYAQAEHVARLALTYPGAEKRAASWLKILANKRQEKQRLKKLSQR